MGPGGHVPRKVHRTKTGLDLLIYHILEDLTINLKADGTPVELLHLATHTSGLPLEADNFDPEMPWEYGPGHLSNFLSRYATRDFPHNLNLNEL